ncbi:hypothetical protein FOQG_18140 [Fusarium oxysporum f. sp. raphani 54005]|uniref:Uncharacterized protein n=1 Tax=Fusarium oxysporum f. sp. raphani 54005 TaxID=1089458 RepID=X0B5U1_FUSOX|nr:hypothetical protein FOQG_18140 [Fusarium oxysporum f. sp. raphani 54005]
MNDDDSDLFSWATDDEDANHELTSQSAAICDATPLGQIRHGRSRLSLLQLAEWDETLAYDEQPPTCVHYLIEWKVKLNNRCISKDTEPDVVLAPGAYWTKYLWSKVDKLAKKKLPANRIFHVDDIDITVCVNYKGEADLNTRSDGLDVNWKMIESKLQAWSHLLLDGKKLKISLSFNYIETSQSGSVVARGRGGRSATASQLAERAIDIGEEETASAEPAVWRKVYDFFRCTGSPCGLGPHCWVDTVGKKHYKLKTHHLRALIEHVRLGNTVDSHDDVPPDVRDLLYAEEEQSIQRKRKRRSSSTDARPVNITNVMPTRTGHSSDDNDTRTPSGSAEGSRYAPKYLGIPGMRDVNVNKYCIWHCSKNANNVWKMEYKKACDLTLAEGLDLEQIRLDQDAQFFIDKGVKKGIAKRWVSDVEVWFRDVETLEDSE